MKTPNSEPRGFSRGTEGRNLSLPSRLEPFDGVPTAFMERAREDGFTEVTLTVAFEVSPDLDWCVDLSFRRTATAPGGWPGIEASPDVGGCLRYRTGRQGRYTIVPALPGHVLWPPERCPENHRERVLAAFLRANHDLFRRTSRRGCRFHVKTVVTSGGKPLAKPSSWRLRWLGRGYRSGAWFLDDHESLREVVRFLCGPREPESPMPQLVPPEG